MRAHPCARVLAHCIRQSLCQQLEGDCCLVWRSSRALPGLGLIASTAIHCIATMRSSPDISRSSTCFDQRWLRTTFRSGAQARLFSHRSHRGSAAELPCSSACQADCAGFAALGITEVISGGLPPAGLMAECTAEHSLGRRGTLPAACLVHRGSVVRDAQSLCSPGSDTGERKRCGLAQFPRRVSN